DQLKQGIRKFIERLLHVITTRAIGGRSRNQRVASLSRASTSVPFLESWHGGRLLTAERSEELTQGLAVGSQSWAIHVRTVPPTDGTGFCSTGRHRLCDHVQ
ncbi:uncharacterized protein SEPMUDRAFT_149209, partial [Sphaerulina musiva SO2202]